MGLKTAWFTAVEFSLNNENIQVEIINHEYFHLLFIASGRVILNLVPMQQDFVPEQLIALQNDYKLQEIHLVHLWEDLWYTKKAQVLSRIKSLLGLNKKVYGRNTSVAKISKADADLFLNQYHLQGSVSARYRYCLVHQHEVVAVATFSNKRKMKDEGTDYFSAELIRFASKDGFTVTGGLSKLVKHYVNQLAPNDLMSYADRDWSLGKGYLSSGFKLKAVTPPAIIYVDLDTLQRYFEHRLPIQQDDMPHKFMRVFNTGNLKYVRIL